MYTGLGKQTLGGHKQNPGTPGYRSKEQWLHKRLFTQICETSGSSIVGLTATSSKRTYVTPRSAAPRVPAFAAGYCWARPPQETFKHSSVAVSLLHAACFMLNHFSHVQLFVTPWTIAHQAPLSMEFFRQEHWSGLPFHYMWNLKKNKNKKIPYN